MRRPWSLVFAATFVAPLVMGCGSPTDTAEERYSVLAAGAQEFSIRYGEEVPVSGSVLRVEFREVLSDSRCPVDVVCVWQGNAELELGIRAGMGPTHSIRLNTTLHPRVADWQDVRITLVELEPEPRSDTTIEPEDYMVRVKLEPLA